MIMIRINSLYRYHFQRQRRWRPLSLPCSENNGEQAEAEWCSGKREQGRAEEVVWSALALLRSSSASIVRLVAASPRLRLLWPADWPTFELAAAKSKPLAGASVSSSNALRPQEHLFQAASMNFQQLQLQQPKRLCLLNYYVVVLSLSVSLSLSPSSRDGQLQDVSNARLSF